MFYYLKASLIISAVSALPLSNLKARQSNELVTPELIPGSCSWQCGPTIAVSSNCSSSDESCICTPSAAYQLQYCLSCFVTQSSAGSLQPNASSSATLTAVEWANNFNSQCRDAGYALPAVFVETSGSTVERATGSDGSPAVPRVGSPPGNANTPAPTPVAPAPPTSTPSPVPSATNAPSVPQTSSSSLITISTPAPTPVASSLSSSSSSPTPTDPADPNTSGFPSIVSLGSQTITIANSGTPVNIPGSNSSDSSSADAAANAAHSHTHRSMTDVWLAMMVGTVSVVAAVLF